MKRPPKRTRGIKSRTRCAKAARRVLNARLRAVEQYLPLARNHANDDTEYVHQLRVWTRRSGAAVRAFDGCLRKSDATRLKRVLRDLRRSAGAARDCDVHLQLFGDMLDRSDATEQPAIRFVIEQLQAERARAQVLIRDHAAVIDKRRLRRLRREVTRRLREPRDKKQRRVKTLERLAKRKIPPLADAIRESALTPNRSRSDTLHQVRIDAKKLRYACEVFEPCLSRKTRQAIKDELLPLLERLGVLNDDTNVIARLEHVAELPGAQQEDIANGLAAIRDRFQDRQRADLARADDAVRAFLNSKLLKRLASNRNAPTIPPHAPVEIESRLVVVADDPADVAARVREASSATHVGPYRLANTKRVRIRDSYYDLADSDGAPSGALPRWGGTLRLRTQDDRLLITLKGPPKNIDVAGGSSRTELEFPWSADALTQVLDALDDAGIATPPADHHDIDHTDPDAALRAHGFVPLLASTTDRTRRDVHEDTSADADTVGEIAIDEVAFDVSGQTVRMYVVEVEAKGLGDANVVRSVTRSLMDSFDPALRAWRANKVRTGLVLRSMVVGDDLPHNCFGTHGELLLPGIERLGNVLETTSSRSTD